MAYSNYPLSKHILYPFDHVFVHPYIHKYIHSCTQKTIPSIYHTSLFCLDVLFVDMLLINNLSPSLVVIPTSSFSLEGRNTLNPKDELKFVSIAGARLGFPLALCAFGAEEIALSM